MEFNKLFKYWCLGVATVGLLGLFGWTASPKHVHSYTLSGNGLESSNNFNIRVDIENAPDDHIPLIGVDYQEAVAIVDSLNKTIPNE